LILLRMQQMQRIKTKARERSVIPAARTTFLSVKVLIALSIALYELLLVIFLSLEIG